MALFWLAALVALFTGIADYGLSATIEDVGLGEYSLVLPLVAVVASTPGRAQLLLRILAGGLVAGTVMYALSDFTFRVLDGDEFLFEVQEITYGLYMSLLVAFVAARLTMPKPPSGWLVAAGGLALVLVFLSIAGGVWISAVVGLVQVAVLAPAGIRLRFEAGVVVTVVARSRSRSGSRS